MAISECFKISDGKSTKLTSIRSLDLSSNCITSQSKTAISTIIQESGVVSLKLSFSELGECGAHKISKAL